MSASMASIMREAFDQAAQAAFGTPAVIGRLATEGGKGMKARIEGGEPDVAWDGSFRPGEQMLPLVMLKDGDSTAGCRLDKAGTLALATPGGGVWLASGCRHALFGAWHSGGYLRRLREGERFVAGPDGKPMLEGAEKEATYSCELMAAGAWAVVAYSANPMFVAGEPIMRLVPGGGWTSSQSKAYMSASGVAVPNLAGVSVRNLRKGERVVIDP